MSRVGWIVLGVSLAALGLVYGVGVLWWWALFGMSQPIVAAHLATAGLFLFAGWACGFPVIWKGDA